MVTLLPSQGRLRAICQMLQGLPEPIFLVGGYVRDWLLGRVSHDLDFAVDGDAVDLARRVANRFGGHFVLLDQEHNTARAVFRDANGAYNVDLAGIRGPDILADLRARDFTMNAIAVALSDLGDSVPVLIDPTCGQEDIKERLVRAASDCSFRDDPIRTLRAVRQAASLGFEIVPATEALVVRDAHLLRNAAGERICAEMAQMLAQPGLETNLRYLGLLGLMAPILPEVWALRDVLVEGESAYELALRTVAGVEGLLQGTGSAGGNDALASVAVRYAFLLSEHFDQVLADIRDRACLLKLVALLADVRGGSSIADEEHLGMMDEILRRLRFSAREIKVACATLHGQAVLLDILSPSTRGDNVLFGARQLYRYYRKLGDAGVDSLCLALAHAWAAGSPERHPARWSLLVALAGQLLDYYVAEWPGIVALPPLLDGRQLMQAFGFQGGPTIGQMLEGIREAQAVGELCTTEQGLAWARSWLSQHREP